MRPIGSSEVDASRDVEMADVRSNKVRALVIGCGNILCGDDAAGPILIRRMWERGLPSQVNCADGGTGGMDVAFQMRGVPHVILVDACRSDSQPGDIFQVPGEELEQLPPMTGINLHSFRWDHALAFGRWLLKEDYPKAVTVFLIEGSKFGVGDELSPEVDRAIDQLVDRILIMLEPAEADLDHSQLPQTERPLAEAEAEGLGPDPLTDSNFPNSVVLEIDGDGYLRMSAEAAAQFFPEDSLVPLWREGVLYLLPTRGSAAGGLVLKQRNLRGDRSLLISEVFQFAPPIGEFFGAWDESLCGLRLDLQPMKQPMKQPIGIYRGVASGMLLPPIEVTPGVVPAVDSLMRGGMPDHLPPEWEFFRAAAENQLGVAADLLQQSINSPRGASDLQFRQVCQYNLFLMNPDLNQLAELQGKLTGELRTLLDFSAYSIGLTDHPPDSLVPLKGELLCWALAVSATADIEQENFGSAREKLAQGVSQARQSSPLLAAILLAQSANVAQSCVGLPAALVKQEYEQAIQLAQQYELPGLVAELYIQIGMLLQQAAGVSRQGLVEAIKAYQLAIQSGIDAQAHPVLFAELQNNLGLAYVTMANSETSNQLRVGIAIQSFRKGLSVIDPTEQPDLWARMSMNLASALQYAPSSHPADNLAQAVEIYEQVLKIRTKARDPVAYALVLLNQANALAHLGIFKYSLEKAAEAYKLFQWYDQAEQATAARELVEQVNLKLVQAGEEHGDV